MLIHSSVKTLCVIGFGTEFTNAHLSTPYRDTGTCMRVSPITRTISGKVHPLSVILRSVSDTMSWIILLVGQSVTAEVAFGSRLLREAFIVDKVSLAYVFLLVL